MLEKHVDQMELFTMLKLTQEFAEILNVWRAPGGRPVYFLYDAQLRRASLEEPNKHNSGLSLNKIILPSFSEFRNWEIKFETQFWIKNIFELGVKKWIIIIILIFSVTRKNWLVIRSVLFSLE